MNNYLIFPIGDKEELTEIVEQAVRKVLQESQDPTPQNEQYITRQTVAEMLNVSLPTLNEWTKQGKLVKYRIGNRVMYKLSEIASIIDDNRVDYGEMQ